MTKPPQDPTARRRTISHAEASPHLADLTLEQLRGYRASLVAEEEKVSYWRRLTHARIDLLEAGSRTDGALSIDDLVRVLGDTGSGRTRKVLLTVRAADSLPELPELDEMWADVTPTDPDGLAATFARLRAAEAQLTEYRRVLHERIDEATGELIVRYRADPTAALALLPQADR